jgi:hypothetical protein
MYIVWRIIASVVCTGERFLCGRRVQRLEVDVVLAKQVFVAPEALQQVSLGKPAAPLTRG